MIRFEYTYNHFAINKCEIESCRWKYLNKEEMTNFYIHHYFTSTYKLGLFYYDMHMPYLYKVFDKGSPHNNPITWLEYRFS